MTPIDGEISRLVERYELPPDAAGPLAALVEALAREVDPPTTIREPTAVVERHLADAFEGLRVPGLASAARIADLGAGAGFPGLPLAVALPGARVDLVESQRRKCAVIERLADAAGLENARALPLRAEDLASGEGRAAYGAVTARAVAPLAVLVEYGAPLLTLGGVLVAWKGEPDEGEVTDGDEVAELVGLQPERPLAADPFPGARRTLYVYSKVKDTPEFLPRRAGMAVKRPLSAS